MELSAEWLWLAFVIFGLLLAMFELFIGIEAGLDLLIVGSAFVFGGLVTWPFHSWLATTIVTAVVCLAYIALGRSHLRRRWAKQLDKTKTNIDATIGRKGVVLQSAARPYDGIVRIENEDWRARADEDLTQGDEVIVIGVQGVTLIVKKLGR